MAKRRHDFLTAYLCRFCGQRVAWSEIVRILHRATPSSIDEAESYAHVQCLRAACRQAVPLTFEGAEAARDRCAFCGRAAGESTSKTLRLQRPTGTVRKPTFAEELVSVHVRCFDKTVSWSS